MSRELRRVLLVVAASAAGFATLILLRVISGEPAIQENDIWVVVIWAALTILLISLAIAADRNRRSRGPGNRR